jgi:hypothetical protein
MPTSNHVHMLIAETLKCLLKGTYAGNEPDRWAVVLKSVRAELRICRAEEVELCRHVRALRARFQLQQLLFETLKV